MAPARSKAGYFTVGKGRYSQAVMDMFRPDETVTLALVKKIWADQKTWGRGLAAAASLKRRTLDHALNVLQWDEDARIFMEEQVERVKDLAGKRYCEHYILSSSIDRLGSPGTLADAQHLWTAPELWHEHVAAIKVHTVLHALDNWDWESEAVLYLQSEVEKAKDLGKESKAGPEPVSHRSEMLRSVTRPRRSPCERCKAYIGLADCRHKPGGKSCVWFQTVNRQFPGRFTWDDLSGEWKEAPDEERQGAVGLYASEADVDSALGMLGLDRFYDSSLLGSAYRRLARSVHPDKNKAARDSDDFRRLRRAFELLESALSREEAPARATDMPMLLALKAPPRRRRWKLGALADKAFLSQRSAMEQAEYDIIRTLLLNAKASKAARDETPWERAWKARMRAPAEVGAACRLMRKRRRVESDEES